MKKINFNKNWKFILENDLDAFNTYGLLKYTGAFGAAARFYNNSTWESVNLPHDWAVKLPKNMRANTFAGARDNTHHHRFATEVHSDTKEVYNIGWYRKEFEIDEDTKNNKRVFLEFEGVFRNASYWVNGVYMDTHFSGYTGFVFEITDHLVIGQNSVAVRVDTEQPEGWFYEGAGIYRNVYMHIGEPCYFKLEQTVVKANNTDGKADVTAVLVNDTKEDVARNVEFEIVDKNGKTVAKTNSQIVVSPYEEKSVEVDLKVDNPLLWSIDEPNLYTLKVTAGQEETYVTFGFRSVDVTADRGLFINGKHVKVRGACVHQDLGGVGVALTENLNRYKIQRLKDMGCNAYRCSHNAPSPDLLKACDELGMLVLDESRAFGTSPEAIRQLTDLIFRDRNHPCVFMWCYGNEEFSVEFGPWSARLGAKVQRIIGKLDDTRLATYAADNGPNVEGVNSISQVRGINYIRNGPDGWVDKYHEDHPNQPIMGTEESSYVLSRGGKKNDFGNCKLDCTGDVTMRWGSTPKGWVKFFEERDFLLGSFMWTGFDYRGEPNPFYNANCGSSFGTIDLCGMEKPPFYYYKAWWTDEDVLKVAPHWDFDEGEEAKLTIFTNCEKVTLYVNGKEIGTQTVEKFDVVRFTLPFEKGTLTAVGIRNGKEIKTELVTPSKIAKVVTQTVLKAENQDNISIIELKAVDKDGNFCPNAEKEILVTPVKGRIVGVGNGDPHWFGDEQPKVTEKARYITTFNSEKGMFTVPEITPNRIQHRFSYLDMEDKKEAFEDDYRIVETFDWYDKKPAEIYNFTASFKDAEKYEYVEIGRIGGNAEVFLNGEKIGANPWMHRDDNYSVRPFRFHCKFKEGENILTIRVASREGFFGAISGYVKLGKLVTDNAISVPLHYGLARVFVQGENSKIKAEITE